MGLKNARLDYPGLAAALDQRGLIDAARLQVALSTCAQTGQPFPEILVFDDMIGDWELSRVVCELYNLPFIPVDFVTPDTEALETFDTHFLQAHRIVPIGRFGDLVTVAMPAIVPAEVLGSLAAALDVHILPVVGTVMTNNRWLTDNLKGPESEDGPEKEEPAVEPRGELRLKGMKDLSLSIPELDTMGASGDGWSNIFDEGNANVLMDLGDPFEDDMPEEPAA
jgi:hypothetical protein